MKSYSLTKEKLELRTKKTELLALVIWLTALDIERKAQLCLPVFF